MVLFLPFIKKHCIILSVDCIGAATVKMSTIAFLFPLVVIHVVLKELVWPY